jgi:hypothetical protein
MRWTLGVATSCGAWLAVARARRLYRLSLVLALLGAGALGWGLAVALRTIDFGVPSSRALLKACTSFVVPTLTPTSVMVLALASLGLAVAARAVRSLARRVWAHRRALGQMARARRAEFGRVAAWVFEDGRPQAFCTGLVRPRIFVSTRAVDVLTPKQLTAVLAHEAHHVRRRDPLRLLVVRVVAEGLFFLPILGRLAQRYEELAEVAADEAALRTSGDDGGSLAGALLAFDARAPAASVGVAAERVDHLMGDAPRWRVPLAVLAGGLLTIAGIAAIAARAAQAGAQGTLSLPLFAAELCMIAMALVPPAVGASLLLLSRRALDRRAGSAR